MGFGTVLHPVDCGLVSSFITNVVLALAAKVLFLAGSFFEATLKFNLTLGTFAASVEGAWRVLRDLINVAFIFGLLWIAISMILGLGDNKKMLMGIIIGALLINFSLFFARVIVDFTNTLAAQFYNQLAPRELTTSIGSASEWWTSFNQNRGVSAKFMEHLNLNTLYSPDVTSTAGGARNVVLAGALKVDEWNVITIGVFGTIFILIAAAVFFVGGLMMIARAAILLFLMATAPVGFLGWLPKLEQYAKQWWTTLWNQALFAPIFLLFMWLTLQLFDAYAAPGRPGGQTASFAQALTSSDTSTMLIILNFVLMIAFMVAGMTAAKSLSGSAGAFASSWGQKALGNVTGRALGGAFGAAGFLGRQGVGRLASKIQENETLKDWDAKNRFFIGKKLYQGTQAAAKGSWDVRGSKVAGAVGGAVGGAMGGIASLGGLTTKVDVGKARGEGGYQSMLDKQVEEREKYIQSRQPNKQKLAGIDISIEAEKRNLQAHVAAGLQDTNPIVEATRRRITDLGKLRKDTTRERQQWAAGEVYSKTHDTLWLKIARKNKLGSAKFHIDELKKEIEEVEKRITEHKSNMGTIQNTINRLKTISAPTAAQTAQLADEERKLQKEREKRTEKEADVASLKKKISELEAERT